MSKIFETYKSQKDIEELAEDIIEKAADSIADSVKKNQSISSFSYRKLNLEKYNEIGDFLREIDGNVSFERYEGDPHKSPGLFNKDTGNIIIRIPDQWEMYGENLEPSHIINFFHDKFFKGKSPFSSLVHELQHAFDRWRSKGKAFKVGKTNKFDKYKISKRFDLNNKFTQYLKLPYEISSRFTETIAEMDYMDENDIIPLAYFLENFRKQFRGWKEMTPKIRKNLMRKASAFWHNKKEELENQSIEEMKIVTLEDYKKLNEDFYNPFEEDDKFKPQKPQSFSDYGGAFKLRKEAFNLGRVEYSKRPGGDYIMVGKTQFAKGEIVEVCPVIMVGEIVKTIDKLKDIIFEIDKKKEQWGLVLGYGSLYRHSQTPTLDYAYNPKSKQMYFITNKFLKLGEELTIDYGTDYWAERTDFHTMAELPNVNLDTKPAKKENESQVQKNSADIDQKNSAAIFNDPNSRYDQSKTAIAPKGMGQQ